MCSRVVEKTCGSARLTLVSLVFGIHTFHSFSVHHSSTDAHKNTRTLTSGVSLRILTEANDANTSGEGHRGRDEGGCPPGFGDIVVLDDLE